MSKMIVNITQHSIAQEIERTLEQYPNHPFQQAFAHPDLRQELLVWILNRVPNVFMTIEESESAIVHPDYAPYCHDHQSCFEYVIRQGIQEVLSQNQQKIEQYIPEQPSGQPATHWFG
ncbi:hypothetical protein ACQ4M3_36405 [Leptolyngbya sp. AN03gr2]|uniref:hypothetical protein n=1 Tax=unclassified Leptolyngbya TaxID=2650499 RepID=UPI003D31A931